MKHAAAFPFSRLQHGPITARRQLCLLLVTLCLSLAKPFAALAQTNAPVSLPPVAQEALNKGIIAAKVPDYLLAIRYFEEARKLAPKAPVIYLNMGLAESRIPGRELRAIAWFGVYLAAYPDAPNAAAVKEQIAVLSVRNQSNVSRLIKAVQDAASQKLPNPPKGSLYGPGEQNDSFLHDAAKLWIEVGDIAAAMKTVSLFNDPNPESIFSSKSHTLRNIAIAQAKSGDIAGAKKNADLVKNVRGQGQAQLQIAGYQTESGDIAGAQKTADLIQDADYKRNAQLYIAEAQGKGGDIAGAQKTFVEVQKSADLIQDAGWKSKVEIMIAESKATAGITNAPNKSPHNKPVRQPAVTVSDWIKILDNDNKNSDCPLSTEPFLDLAANLKFMTDYLKSKPEFDNPEMFFKALHDTAEKIVKAQNVITGMLKQQAKR